MLTRFASIFLRSLCVGTLLVPATYASDWPQFLGPDRNGVVDDSKLIDSFPQAGPEVVWSVPTGAGMAAVAVVDGVAYSIWNDQKDQALFALDAKTGKQLWRTVIGKAYSNAMGDGPRATPAIANGTIFAYSGDGILSAVNAKDGKLIWRADLMQLCKTQPSEYGMSASPLVVDDQVIVHVGGKGCAIVSINALTGKIRWQAGDGPAGYSSPTVATLHGIPQIISFTGNDLYGIEAESGKVLWSYPFETDYACNTANPVVIGDSVFISAGENHGCVLLDIAKNDQRFEARERWQSTFTKSVMRNEWQTSIVVDGFLYGFDNVGAAGPVTHLSCIEVATGNPVWRVTRFGKGNMVRSKDKFWITTMDGDLVLAKLDASGFQEISRANCFNSTRQTMTISNGLGYVRDKDKIICFKLRD